MAAVTEDIKSIFALIKEDASRWASDLKTQKVFISNRQREYFAADEAAATAERKAQAIIDAHLEFTLSK